MPLIVKPNPRRMQAFRDSPSERGFVRGEARPAPPVAWRPALVVGGVVIALVLLLAAFLT